MSWREITLSDLGVSDLDVNDDPSILLLELIQSVIVKSEVYETIATELDPCVV